MHKVWASIASGADGPGLQVAGDVVGAKGGPAKAPKPS